jgi:2,3-bisphosphoglycerate-dependent phosphoglycerate mutase
LIEAILVRHGQSEANAAGIVNGDPSVPYGLTDEGRRHATALGEALAGQRIDLCMVTEFLRTRQTADLITRGRDIPRLLVPELNDPVFGALEGRPLAEVRAWLVEHGPAARPAGGESRVESVARYRAGYRRLLARPEGVVLVVAHGLPITLMRLAEQEGRIPLTLEGIPPGHAEPVRLGPDQLRRGLEVMDAWAAEAVSA